MRRLFPWGLTFSLCVLPVLALGQSRTPPPGSTSSGSAAPRTGGNETAAPRNDSSPSPSSSSSSSSSPSSSSSRDMGGASNTGGWNSFSPNTNGALAPPSISRNVRSGDASAIGRERPPTVGQPVPLASRPRGDRPAYGTAVPRASAPPPPATGSFVGYVGADNFWGSDAYWGYSPLYFAFDPFWPLAADVGGGLGGGTVPYYQQRTPGGLKLKVTPKEAEVYVDATYMGRVKDFDGKHVKMDAGTHTIEVRAQGYDTLQFEIRIMPGRTVTYQGALLPVVRK